MGHLVHLSYVGRVVSETIVVVGGTLAILGLALPIIGITYSVLGIVALVSSGILLGILTRPEPGGPTGLPPTMLPERPRDFGFLKWWEFRRQ
jgi:hypothetical protein